MTRDEENKHQDRERLHEIFKHWHRLVDAEMDLIMVQLARSHDGPVECDLQKVKYQYPFVRLIGGPLSHCPSGSMN